MGTFRTTVIAAVVLAAAGTAQAGIQTNGIQTNGVLWANGIQTNGIQTNGIQTNGIQTNGIQTNGIQTNGIQTNGIVLANASVAGTQVVGTFIGSGAGYSCAHREDVYGSALPQSCSPCAKTVGTADSYCSTTGWDSVCISEAQSMCKATLTTGSTLTATMTDGSTRAMKVGTRYQGGVVTDQWGLKIIADNTDVWTQDISWVLPHAPSVAGDKLAAGQLGNACVKQVCAADSYCCNTSWDQQCVNEGASMCTGLSMGLARIGTGGDSVCGYDPNTGSARQGMFVGGTWDMHSGAQGNGGKTSSSGITVACRAVGAVAKCVDMGYKPWKSGAQEQLHQACVRMVRADYCGDGTTWTQDGTTINVADYAGIQTDSLNWTLEATWNPRGARTVFYSRLWQSPVRDWSSYVAGHPYCTYNPATGTGFQIADPYADQALWASAATLDGTTKLLRTESNQACIGGPTSMCNPDINK